MPHVLTPSHGLFFALALTGFGSLQSVEANPAPYQGQAYDLGKGQLLYTETHQESFSNGQKTAIYTLFQNPQGQPIAERHLDFSRSPMQPGYIFKDFRNGYEEGAAVSGNRVRVYYRDSQASPLRQKSLNVPEPFVIDGGFNNFLKQNWDSLTAGHRLHFHFVAPARLDYYAFVAHEDARRVPKGMPARAFVVEVDNALLRLLVSPIVILYDSSSRKMMQYQGITNIHDARGNGLKVRLIYPEPGP